jgi:hypothetical protein
MQRRKQRVLSVAAVAVVIGVTHASAEPTSCQKQILKQLFKFEKVYLKKAGKCLDKENALRIPGPCPDELTLLKADAILAKAQLKVGAACTAGDLATLGYSSTCDFEAGPGGSATAICSALPAGTPEELAACLACWKRAEANEYLAVLYASHAEEICDGALDETSPACSPLTCTIPLPDQRDLGDTAEGTCQKAIGKSAVKHAIKLIKLLEKCARAGGTQASCEADEDLQNKLAKLDAKLETKIKNKCGNTTPAASTPFCCRTGGGNTCTEVATRTDCLDLEGTVQEGKFCDVDSTCGNPPGPNKQITWWETCPTSTTCPGTALASIEDVVACVAEEADTVVAEMLCRQLPTGWSCASGSPSGAFL